MTLTENFALEEFEQSETASRLGIDNSIHDYEVLMNIKALCEAVLQPLRNAMKMPLTISSGYRCDELNEAVGGVETSQHRGIGAAAADVKCRVSSMKLAQTAHNNAEIWEQIDQMIIYPSFVHFSHRNDGSEQRNQVLYHSSYTGKKI